MLRLDITPQRAPDKSPYEALVVPALRSVDIKSNIAGAALPSLKTVFRHVVEADPVSYYRQPARSQVIDLSSSRLPNRSSFFDAVIADRPPTA